MDVEPHATPMDWLTDSAAAAQQAAEGLDWESSGWVIAALVGVGILRKFGPLLGPIGNSVAQGIGALAGQFLPKQEKEANRRMKIAEGSLWQIVDAIEQVSPDDPVVGRLKKAISEKTPAEFNALFDEWKKARQ